MIKRMSAVHITAQVCIFWFCLVAFGAKKQGFLDKNKSRHPASLRPRIE
jgi:hypothetical protein